VSRPESEIQQYDIDRRTAEHLQRLSRGTALTDNFEANLRRQKPRKAGPEQTMVIEYD